MKAEEVTIREAKLGESEQAAELIVRMKRLNGEFDPLLGVVEDALEKAVSYVTDSIKSDRTVTLVAVRGGRVLGALRAELRERPFYRPSPEGIVTDLYVLPEVRRRGIGDLLLKEAWKRLSKLGAAMMTAEVPAQNEIAAKFYRKRGFRSLLNHYAKEEFA